MSAVHFGAGNIGRGFIGLLLAEAGHDVVFADVNAELVDTINRLGGYTVHEVGEGAREHTVTGVSALNSLTQRDELTAAIAAADVVTTAVGPSILARVAPAIAAGLLARPDGAAPAWVMACENAVNATETLAAEVRLAAGDRAAEIDERAVFANTAVDRIVPGQEPDGADVTVEAFHEWTIEAPSGGPTPPEIPGAHIVDALGPFIERKLFTVNTGHATVAYLGAARGFEAVSDAASDPEIAARLDAVLAETSLLLAEKHGLDEAGLAEYRATIVARFRNTALPDTTARVGRAPLRKLSREERFISPAAQLAERGHTPSALLSVIPALLAFAGEGDEEAERLHAILAAETAEGAVAEVTGIEQGHPLYAALVAAFAGRTA